jgi:outer membrane protein assembly factor BamB
MSASAADGSTARKPLRLWPGAVAALVLVLVRFGVPAVFPDGAIFGLLGSLVLALVILAWWLLFSRAPWSERVLAIVLMIAAIAATARLVHPSIRGGMMGMMLPIHATPGLAVALVAWAAATRRLAPRQRIAALAPTIVVAAGVWVLLRTDGITGAGESQLTWRWTPTAEERLLAQSRNTPADVAPRVPADSAPSTTPSAPATALSSASSSKRPEGESAATQPATVAAARTSEPASSDSSATRLPEAGPRPSTSPPKSSTALDVRWPGFRGANRDGIIRGVSLDTNWSAFPPVELWRRPVGPGWSSFAIRRTLIYTQEQRGDDEVVASYDAATGKPVWMHRDSTRFWESNGGAGPRATPTIGNDRVYALGATGRLNALDALSGAVRWSHDAVTDAGVTIPGWGIAGSPLVVGDLVIVAASGALVAYDRITGVKRWVHKSEGGSYSSPQLATIDGTTQILLLAGHGLVSVAPGDGTVLWEHPWAGVPIVQPALIAGGDFLISTAGGMSGSIGMRRVSVAHASDPARGATGTWTVEERWTSNSLKPYFNDFVVHKGHAFGFDGFILACIDVADGRRKWKGGRYGNGQLVLLPDQDLLLVLSEEGELALVGATPDRFTELARARVLEGKTWNHPVLAGDLLLVRNGEQMAAFRMPLAAR